MRRRPPFKRVTAGTAGLRDPARIFRLLRERLALLGRTASTPAMVRCACAFCASAAGAAGRQQNPLGLRWECWALRASRFSPILSIGWGRGWGWPRAASLATGCASAGIRNRGNAGGLSATRRFKRPDPPGAPEALARPCVHRLFEQRSRFEACGPLAGWTAFPLSLRRACTRPPAFRGTGAIAAPWWRAPRIRSPAIISIVTARGVASGIYRRRLAGQECAQRAVFMLDCLSFFARSPPAVIVPSCFAHESRRRRCFANKRRLG